MKRLAQYHPGRVSDNARAIASGELRFLLDCLRDLAQIIYDRRDPKECYAHLRDRAFAAMFYAEALAAHLGEKGAGRPRGTVTASDAVRANLAADDYKREISKKKPAALAEKIICDRHDITRKLLRDALDGKFPPGLYDPF